MNKNKKKKVIISSACGTLVIGLSAFAGYEYGKSSTQQTSTPIQNIAQAKKINYADKISNVVVSEITEDGYATLHGDHSHFIKGLVPYNAKILDSLVYKNENYTLKKEDIQYELAQGYVIKIDGKFYYYPKKDVKQTNVVDEKTAKELSAHSHHHHHHGSSSNNNEDNYVFNPKDIVSETPDGYVVRHGDHFHYIKKSELSAAQLQQAKQNGVNNALSHSTAGITTPTSDGYIFKGESDIVGRNSFGFIVQHGNHQHIIPFEQLRGTKWEYLLNNQSNYSSAPSFNNPSSNTSSNHDDGYVFNPNDIVSEDEYGYTVRHGDHYHYIPKNNVSHNNSNGNYLPRPFTPTIPHNDSNNHNHHSNHDHETNIKPHEDSKPLVPSTPINPEKKEQILSFAGVQFKTSDGFILTDSSITTPTSSGLLVAHDGHEHFVFYNQLVNSKWEKLIPHQYLNKAKEEYNKLENEVNNKIQYLKDKLNIDPKNIKFIVTNKGEALTYNGTTTLLKDIVLSENNNNENNDNNVEKETQDKINYLAKLLNIDAKQIKIIDSEKGKALVYPHGDHTHTILLDEIHIDSSETKINDDIQRYIDYISEVYGVPKEAIRVTNDFFVFNEPSHAYDPTHIHPYLIPRSKFKIPVITGDEELDFEQELLALSERTGIAPDKIKVENGKFVIPHGDHDHFVKILSKGSDEYFKNKIPNITGVYVTGDFDKNTVLSRISELKKANEDINKADTKKIRRINRALEQLKQTIEELPTNSTKGYLEMLNDFDKKYIHIDSSFVDTNNKEIVKKYNDLLTRVKESNINDYGFEKKELTDLLNTASSEKNTETFEKVEHILNEVKKFDNQTGPTALSYIKYFLENLDSEKIDNDLREELASLIKDTYESEAKISNTATGVYVNRLIKAKNALHYALEQNNKNEVKRGYYYNKLLELDEDENKVLDSARGFVSELSDFLPTLEFSNANYPEKITAPTVNSSENNNSNNEEKEIQDKINYLANGLHISPDTIKIIDTENGKALVVPHDDHSHVLLLKDIDTSSPIKDLHHNAGVETLKKLGFDDDIIHDIQHATADSDFPEHETNTEKMKEWLKTVKYLNIGENKDPLKRKGLDLMPNIEVLGVGFTPIDDITPVYQFKKLKQLYVTRTGITDYSFIKNIPTLEGIDLSENNISDISFLKEYPNLKVVAAAGNNIENIDVLKELPKLESLNLDNNSIKNIDSLKELTNLKAVSLENNKLTKLDSLNNLPNLTRLYLSNNSGLELFSLKNSSLEELTVNNSNLRDLSAVENLPALTELVANNNKITTLSHLKNAEELDTVEVNNNNIDKLDFENNSISSLEIKNNKLTDIDNINKLSALRNLDASDNNISNFPKNKQESLINLTLTNNRITTLENINNFTSLKYLTIPNNYVSTLKISEKNNTIEYLDISKNNIADDELAKESGNNIPKGISNNFSNVRSGSIENNYSLSVDYIIAQSEKLQEEILKLKEDKKLKDDIADELKQKARVIYLDISYSVNKGQNKLISLDKELSNIRKNIQENLLSAPANESHNDSNSHHEHSDEHDEHSDNHSHDEHEHHFEFDVNNIVSEENDGYIVSHGDHNHFVKKSELTPEQLKQAEQFLVNKQNNSASITDSEIAKKKNYIALFYGVNEEDIVVDNNSLTFNYNGIAKKLLLSDINVPAMSSNLVADFEKEITALATSMNTTVEHIQIQDGVMVVNHGDHNHYYPIKSPGWRLYNKNKIPYIEIPKVNGEIDEAVVNNKITELENKSREIFADNPEKLNQALAWLNHFREFSLPWHLTSTEGYLQTLDNFEQTQLK